MAEGTDASSCRAEYVRPGGRDPGDRTVRCGLPAGHNGAHEEEGTEVTWQTVTIPGFTYRAWDERYATGYVEARREVAAEIRRYADVREDLARRYPPVSAEASRRNNAVLAAYRRAAEVVEEMPLPDDGDPAIGRLSPADHASAMAVEEDRRRPGPGFAGDVKSDVLLADGTHRYWSTHCRHDNHEACSARWLYGPDGVTAMARRPASCKTCQAPCGCPCHKTMPANDLIGMHIGPPLLVHDESVCAGEVCCVHNPSDHHMRSWPQLWRDDRQLMERVCWHGVGHPDPDDIAYKRRARGERFAGYESVHSCDGCCPAVSGG